MDYVYLLVFLSALATLEEVSGNYLYLGCFHSEEYVVGDLNDMVVTGATDNTPTSCGSICAEAGFRYAGLMAGSTCRCGNTYEQYKSRSDCTTSCPGDNALMCGGTTSVSVYATGKACFSELWNKQLYYLTDPTATAINISGEIIANQYGRKLGQEGCQRACALDNTCMAYTYFTSDRHSSLFGERCFGFTINADISEDTDKNGIVSGKTKACYADDAENYIGELIGMILAILLFLTTLVLMDKWNKNQLSCCP